MAPDATMTIDRATGMADGHAIPEADRDVFKKPIHYRIKDAIQAIPFKDENGDEIVGDEDQVVIAGITVMG